MRNWREGENIPFEAFLSPDGIHMNDWSYGCVAKLLAAVPVRGRHACTHGCPRAGVF